MYVQARLTMKQKILLTCGSSLGALANPLRSGIFFFPGFINEDLVAAFGEITGKGACQRMREEMLKSDDGRYILRKRPRVSALLPSLESLAEYPDDSFGKHHYLFFKSHGLTPNNRPEVQYIEDEELAYIMQRYRENHDYMHTLCDLPISVVSELCLKRFEFQQTGLPMTFFGSMFGPLALNSFGRRDYYKIYKPWADKAAKESKFFMNVHFEDLLSQNIDYVRKMLNLKPFSQM